jgi:uncharacterized protein YwbE
MNEPKLAISCFALAAIAAIALGPVSAAAQDKGAITVFVAKKIVTMDPGWPAGTAVAVQDGRVLSVGIPLHWVELAAKDGHAGTCRPRRWYRLRLWFSRQPQLRRERCE